MSASLGWSQVLPPDRDPELTRRTLAAWEAAWERYTSGDLDGLRRAFVAGYLACAADLETQ